MPESIARFSVKETEKRIVSALYDLFLNMVPVER